ncbi:hypothetical pox protein [Squirrelpox virus]|uniref:Hypothetical pox protein n=1 Tax=Squirrelpox virus TaxID=240426 RepID=Q1HTV1_9POXV|nr:hypothetical pox protein [Squirrelpox virus]ABD51435.1 K1L [Squirrelpox virus]CCD83184.1 hypothetical pox protein [Squirrelpox virus]
MDNLHVSCLAVSASLAVLLAITPMDSWLTSFMCSVSFICLYTVYVHRTERVARYLTEAVVHYVFAPMADLVIFLVPILAAALVLASVALAPLGLRQLVPRVARLAHGLG